jgi:hypothetical protein
MKLVSKTQTNRALKDVFCNKLQENDSTVLTARAARCNI